MKHNTQKERGKNQDSFHIIPSIPYFYKKNQLTKEGNGNTFIIRRSVMVATIGIKIANGQFYPIMDENSVVPRKVKLTTVKNNQRTIQIDLYKSYTRTMADVSYIGSLVLEHIRPRPAKAPDIVLTVNSSPEGKIEANAIDTDPDSHDTRHYLTVSLQSLEKDTDDFELPNFSLDEAEDPPQELYEKPEREEKKKKLFPWLITLIAGLLVIITALALWVFLSFKSGTETPASVESPSVSAPPGPDLSDIPVIQAPPPEPEPSPAPVVSSPEPAPVVETPAPPVETPPPVAAPRSSRPRAPVYSSTIPSTIPAGGLSYRVRWGDTLWDISEAFYRSPWLYGRIARYNGISNPDHIVSGTVIRVPPRN
jgi:hypothetical protein